MFFQKKYEQIFSPYNLTSKLQNPTKQRWLVEILAHA